MRDYQAVLSYQRKKSFGQVYSFRPETYLAFILKQSGLQAGSKKFNRLKQTILKTSIGESFCENLKLPDQILAQVRNSIEAEKRKPLLDDYIGESFYKNFARPIADLGIN